MLFYQICNIIANTIFKVHVLHGWREMALISRHWNSVTKYLNEVINVGWNKKQKSVLFVAVNWNHT